MFSKNVIGLLNLFNAPSLGELSNDRAPSSMSYLGRYALMDIPLSNFSNSGIDIVGIMIKEKIISVLNHLGSLRVFNENTKIGKETIMFNEGATNQKENTDISCMNANPWVTFAKNVDLVVIQSSHILTNINLKNVVKSHIKSGKDITICYKKINDADKAFLKSQNIELNKIIRLKENDGKSQNVNTNLEIYVISRDLLVKISNEYLNKDKTISLDKAIMEMVNNNELSVNPYEYKGYARSYDSMEHYLEYSLEILDYDVAKEMFKSDWPYYTITHDTPPAKYAANADVKDSFVANGAVVDGKVNRSIISRNVIIKKGAVVTNSVILSNTVIEENAHLDNVIIDKHAYVSKDTNLIGKKDNPIYLGKGKRI